MCFSFVMADWVQKGFFGVPILKIVSKAIAISDSLYRKLKRLKGRRTFSATIEDSIGRAGRIADVVEMGILEESTREEVRQDFADAGRRTARRLGHEVDSKYDLK